MDLQKFEIIVNAMLSWSDEAKSPKRAASRGAAPAESRFALEDEDDEIIDDHDLEPEDEPPGFPKAGARPDAELADEDESETVD